MFIVKILAKRNNNSRIPPIVIRFRSDQAEIKMHPTSTETNQFFLLIFAICICIESAKIDSKKFERFA